MHVENMLNGSNWVNFELIEYNSDKVRVTLYINGYKWVGFSWIGEFDQILLGLDKTTISKLNFEFFNSLNVGSVFRN